MQTTTETTPQSTDRSVASVSPSFSKAEPEVYRAMSRGAIATLVLGILGLLAFELLPLLLLPIVGLAFAASAMIGFRKYPDELTGRPMAIAGAVLCGATVVLAPIYHSVIYMTEVPEGYTRVNFAVLKSPPKQPDVPTEAAIALDGQHVFIKGYIHPSSMDTLESKRFVLVPDLGTCCFGKQPPLTHMIEVTMSGEQYAKKSMRKQRLAGTLHVNPNLKPIDGLTGVFYQLKADILK